MHHKQSQSGFALLISLIVVGVVISVGVSILDLSRKQVQLASNAKESEIAFHAANAGVECARFVRRDLDVEMETGQNINPNCFGVSAGVTAVSPVPTGVSLTGGAGDMYQYEYELEWGSSPDIRCTRINTVVASTSVTNSVATTINGMNNLVLGYPEDSPGSGTYTLTCDPGARCTAISVQGYNQRCSAITNVGVVQREVLLQF